MTSTLRFEIETEDVPGESPSYEPYMLVHVIPVIDSAPYIGKHRAYPFEPLEVYGFGLISGEIWPFNCACGDSACARIYEPTLMTVNDTSVQWAFPEEPYDDLATTEEGHPKPRKFVFDRQLYTNVFEDLVAELKILEACHGKISLAPASSSMLSVDQTIRLQQNFAEFRRIRRAALGGMDHENMEFVVTSADGLELATNLSQIVFDAARPYHSGDFYDLARVQEVLERLGHELRATPQSVLRRMDIHDLSAKLRAAPTEAESDDADHYDSEEHWPAPYWTDADSPAEHLEFWRELQRSGNVTIRPRGY